MTEVFLPPGHRREIWRYRPTGEEFAVQVNISNGRVQYARGPINGPANFGGGKFGLDTGKLLPSWLYQRRGDCDVLRYRERLGVISAVAGTDATVTWDNDRSEMTIPVTEIALLDPTRVEVGIRVVAVHLGDKEPAFSRDPRR